LQDEVSPLEEGSMPELPEVETVRRGLEPVVVGRRIVSVDLARPDLRFAFPEGFARRLEGHTVTALQRRAKYLIAPLSSGESWLVHLGMTGRFTLIAPGGVAQNLAEFYYETGADGRVRGPHDHVVIDLEGDWRLVYSDPRRFGVMDIVAAGGEADHPLLKDLGIEPLGNAMNAQNLAPVLAGRKAPLKAALLDQKIIAGLGNIYVCEAMWRSALSPSRHAGSLVTKAGQPRVALERLVAAIRAVLADALAAGGSTLRDYAGADGAAGTFQQRFDVYDREGEACKRRGCGGTIRRKVQAGRSSFHCPRCQR
jgi:formamidopyrimidine-DNA glycosylase